MKEDPKRKKPPGTVKKNGFYVALYSCVGIMLALAVVIGYNNFSTPKPGLDGLTAKPPDNIDVASVGKANESEFGYLTPRDKAGIEQDIGTAIFGTNPDAPANGSTIGSAGKTDDVMYESPYSSVPSFSETDFDNPPEDELSAKRGKNTEQPESSAPPENGENSTSMTDEPSQDDSSAIETSNSDDIGVTEQPNTAPSEFMAFSDNASMVWPVIGDIVMDYSVDHVIYDKTLEQYRINNILCISSDEGTDVRAAAAGRVAEITSSRQGGRTVVLDNGNGWSTTYSQLQDAVAVNVGDVVEEGQVIGRVGKPSLYTGELGSHLGFAVAKDTAYVNPKDLLVIAE